MKQTNYFVIFFSECKFVKCNQSKSINKYRQRPLLGFYMIFIDFVSGLFHMWNHETDFLKGYSHYKNYKASNNLLYVDILEQTSLHNDFKTMCNLYPVIYIQNVTSWDETPDLVITSLHSTSLVTHATNIEVYQFANVALCKILRYNSSKFKCH